MRKKKRKKYKREQRSFYFTNLIEVERIYSGSGGKGKKREKKKKPTEEQIKKQNQLNREKKSRRILLANFEENDLWVLLTYLKGFRTNIKAAKKDFGRFIRMLRREWRKRGHELKWVVRTEIGKKGAAHHHLLVNRIPDGDIIIKDCWRKIEGAGFPSYKHAYEEGGFESLAYYITKPPDEDGEEEKTERNYSRSRNLIIPEPEITRALKREMQNPPEPLPGYYIDESSVVMGTNPVTGCEYQYFTMYRLERKPAKRQMEAAQRLEGGG